MISSRSDKIICWKENSLAFGIHQRDAEREKRFEDSAEGGKRSSELEKVILTTIQYISAFPFWDVDI
jgi:hypothetical protein